MDGVRPGYHSINAYINASDAEGVIAFLVEVFGGAERGERETRADGSIDHAEVVIGDSVVMVSQASREMPARPTILFAYVADVDETYRAAVASGSESISVPRDQPWGDRVGGVHDPWGNRWWIATETSAHP